MRSGDSLGAGGDFTSWRETYSRELKDVLGLKGSPVAVAYSDQPARNDGGGRYRVCGAMPSSRDGAVISLDRRNCSCRGAPGHLGLGPPATELEELLHCGFLAHGERLWQSLGDARRVRRHMSRRAPSPRGFGDYLVFSPLERAEIKPDLVLFLCNPEQACRLTALARYREGLLPPNEMEGSLCWSAIAYPFVTGNVNITLGDSSARRIERWDPWELIVSVPAEKLHGIVDSIDRSTAGSARPAWRLKESPARVDARREQAAKVPVKIGGGWLTARRRRAWQSPTE